MTQRASPSEQIGSAGESETAADFERLGWGVAVNARHDHGTDLILWARDARGFELGLFVGAQVKTGESQFDEPHHDETGELTGWWFRDADRSHVDDWIEHGSPHLIILHDLANHTSYWEHITTETVIPTGIGAKVLVPKANTVDVEHRDALLAVAATRRSNVVWEGSAWTGATSLSPRDLLRHALVVPRLVAPHPNAGTTTPLVPEQAVALLVQGRLRDLDRFAQVQADVPTLTEATTSTNWYWRYVGALGHYLTTGDSEALFNVYRDAAEPAGRAASCVSAISALMTEARADEAVDFVELELSQDGAEPVDHAWLQVQFARACAEIGRVGDARSAAFDAQAIRITYPHDVTATALAGIAAELLFDTGEWGQQDLASLITLRDTTAAWWRAQTMSFGLEALAERAFKGWARDKTVTLGGEDRAHNQLYAASLAANNMGDHSSWRHLSGLLGEDTLLRLRRDSDSESAVRGLNSLRLAGEEGDLKLAVRRLSADGPSDAVRTVAAGVRLDAATATTAPADLALLEYGGDLVDETTADRTIAWVLATLTDPSQFLSRTRPTYLVNHQLLQTLAAILPAASIAGRRPVLSHLTGLEPQTDQLIAIDWASVVAAIPDEAWDEEMASSLFRSINGHHESLQLAVLTVAARFDRAARSRLLDEAQNKSLGALSALGDVRSLEPKVVISLVDDLTEKIDKQISDASAGAFGYGSHDFGRALALLCAWHPDLANWNPLLTMLHDRRVMAHHKRGALGVLASLAAQLPDEVRQNLKSLVATTPEGTTAPADLVLGDGGDLTGAFADLAAALDGFDEDAVAETLLDLLGGDGERRQWAAQVARRLGRAEDTGILVTLVHDPEPEVRAVAAMGLASLVAAREGGQVALTGLLQCLRDPGAVVPYHAASVLAGSPMRSSEAADALASMRTHISARVRSIAVGADSSYAAYDEHPISEEDGWGDLESFRQAAGSS